MRPSDRYLKIVEWSDEDQCYVGTCPGLAPETVFAPPVKATLLIPGFCAERAKTN